MSDDRVLDLRTGLAITGWAIALFYLVSSTAIGWDAPHGVPTVCSYLMVLLVILLATPGPHRAARVGLRMPHARFVIAAILVGLTGGFALAGVNQAFAKLFGPPPPTWRPEDLSVALLVGAALPALCEELLFRGVLVRSLATAWSWPRAILVSALAFALWHHSPHRLVSPFLDGLILGYLALRSGSIVPGVLMHFLHNAVIALQVDDVPAPFWRWVQDHHDALLGPAALIAFAGVVIATRGEPIG